MSDSWLFWTVPEKHVRRYLVLMLLVLFILPNYIFGIRYTLTGLLVNLVWFDMIFYGWAKVKDKLEGEDK